MNKFFHYVLCFGFLFFSMFSNADTTKNVITPISIEDEIKDKSIDEVLSIVIYRNDVEKMKELLADNIDVNVTDEFGFTPLMIAVQADRVEVVKLLIEAGADINKQDEFGNSMLILAIQRNRENVLDIVNTFLLAGIDVESKTESGLTALMEASFLGQKNMVELLLDAGADVNSQDNNGHIALEYALFNKQLEIAELLKSVKTK